MPGFASRRGSKVLALVMTVLLLVTGAIVLAAAARARCEGRIAKAGTNRADVMRGNRRANKFAGRGGNDRLYGKGGGDRLCGNGGKDRLVGGGGKDQLNGGGGSDVLNAGSRNDLLKGGGGGDKLYGGAGRDRLIGGRGRDLLDGGKGFDTCSQGDSYVRCERIISELITEVRLGIPSSTFGVAATGIAPGDEIERILDLANSSTASLSRIVLTTTAAPSSVLDADATDGLQMTIKRCSISWRTVVGDAPSYACDGTVSIVAPERPVIVSQLDLGALSALQPGGRDHLLVRLRLPATAPEAAQGAASVISYNFNA